jgi:hypothetical protein
MLSAIVVFGLGVKPRLASHRREVVAPHRPRVTIQMSRLIVALGRHRFQKARIAVSSGSGSFGLTVDTVYRAYAKVKADIELLKVHTCQSCGFEA